MIFRHTLPDVLNQRKRQTRRRRKPGEYAQSNHETGEIERVYTAKGRVKWEVGKTYSVQPGRNKKGVARIKITGIRSEDVRNISDVDAIAEGFKDRVDFLLLWVEMHDKPKSIYWESDMIFDENGKADWYPAELEVRPTERYRAWVLTFELCEDSKSGTISA